jgi:hypothetical protein
MFLPSLILSTVLIVMLLLGAYTCIDCIVHYDMSKMPVLLLFSVALADILLVLFVFNFFQQYLQLV